MNGNCQNYAIIVTIVDVKINQKSFQERIKRRNRPGSRIKLLKTAIKDRIVGNKKISLSVPISKLQHMMISEKVFCSLHKHFGRT